MGRIDEALRRSNLDAAQGTGAETTPPATSPWQVGQHDDGNGPGPEDSAAGERATAEPADSPASGTDRRPRRWDGFDADAVKRLVAAKNAEPLLVEQYRRFAAVLLRAQGERNLKTVIVTSASPGDGKSHVAVNLALTLSESYRRQVLLIDGDLRRPTLHLLFGVPNRRGLSDTLNETVDQKAATAQINETLALLPAGRSQLNPLSGLSSDRLKRMLTDAASRFDWVIVDSPPVGVLADAHLVSEVVDAAILVVRAGVTQFPDLEAAAQTLGRERILGIVLNAVDPVEIRGEGYYNYYSSVGRGGN
jgi:capsular exopolysaccharide synthesis family protein